MVLIDKLQDIIKEYNEVDLLNLTYKDLLRIEHCIEQLQLNHETTKIRIKSEILKEQDFIKLFVLNSNKIPNPLPVSKPDSNVPKEIKWEIYNSVITTLLAQLGIKPTKLATK